MAKPDRNNRLFILSLLVPLTVACIILGFVIFLAAANPHPDWKTYESQRIRMTFKYPPTWKISSPKDAILLQSQSRKEEIEVYGDCKTDGNSCSMFGFILTEQVPSPINFEGYIHNTYNIDCFDMKLTKTKIGNLQGFLVSYAKIDSVQCNRNLGGTFGVVDRKYIVFQSNLVHSIDFSNALYWASPSKSNNEVLINQILASMHFN